MSAARHIIIPAPRAAAERSVHRCQENCGGHSALSRVSKCWAGATSGYGSHGLTIRPLHYLLQAERWELLIAYDEIWWKWPLPTYRASTTWHNSRSTGTLASPRSRLCRHRFMCVSKLPRSCHSESSNESAIIAVPYAVGCRAQAWQQQQLRSKQTDL